MPTSPSGRESVNRWTQKHGPGTTQKRLTGIADPRGPVGIFSRGKNIYQGATTRAQSGGGRQYGRPTNQPGVQTNSNPHQAAIMRRLQRR